MTENTTDSGAIEPKSSAQDQVEASGTQDQRQEDTVAYDTYRRTLSESKKAKSEAAELKAKIEQYEKSKLEEQGKWQDLAESANKKASDYESRYKQLEAQVAEERIRSQVELKAKDLGCIDTELLIKAMDVEGLDVVDGYKVSPQSLEQVLMQVKQKKPHLFSKPAPSIQDGVPAMPDTRKTNDYADMSIRDKARLLFKEGNR